MSRITAIASAGAMGATATRLTVARDRSVDVPGAELICEATGSIARAGSADAFASKECL